MFYVMCACITCASWSFSNWNSPPCSQDKNSPRPFSSESSSSLAPCSRRERGCCRLACVTCCVGLAMSSKEHVLKTQPLTLTPLCLLSGSYRDHMRKVSHTLFVLGLCSLHIKLLGTGSPRQGKCLCERAGTCDLEHWVLGGGTGPGSHWLVEQTAGSSA